MGFSDRLNRAITEAADMQTPEMLSAQSRVERSKQDQHVRMVEQASDQAVAALQRIERVLNAPGLKNNPALEPMTAQLKAMIAGLDNDGVMRRNLMSLLAAPQQAQIK